MACFLVLTLGPRLLPLRSFPCFHSRMVFAIFASPSTDSALMFHILKKRGWLFRPAPRLTEDCNNTC
jgi:hypothetical protein